MKNISAISQIVDHFRSQLNPLRGLNMQRVVEYLEAGERGEYPDLQWLYRFIEKRDATLRACKRRLQAALLELDWTIKISPEIPEQDQKLAEAQQEFLRAAYDQIENLREGVSHLALADFRGFAHVEKIFSGQRIAGKHWAVKRLEPVPQWHWVRKGVYGEWQFVANATNTSAGEPIKPEQFIVREVEDPINEIALIAFVRKSLSQKDWDGFVEMYGIPWVFFLMPDGVQEGTPEHAEWQNIVNNAMSGSRIALPAGTQVQGVDNGAKSHPFEAHIAQQDREIVLAATSSLLTMLTESGSGTLAGGAHSETFEAIAKAQAMMVSEILQEQMDKPWLSAQFPDQPIYAYFEFGAQDEDDITEILGHAEAASRAGLRIDPAEIAEKTGYTITEAPAAPAPAMPQSFNTDRVFNKGDAAYRQDDFSEAAMVELSEAMRKDLQALYAEIDGIRAIEDPAEYSAALSSLRERLPETLHSALESGNSIDALERIFGAAIISGATTPESPKQPKS